MLTIQVFDHMTKNLDGKNHYHPSFWSHDQKLGWEKPFLAKIQNRTNKKSGMEILLLSKFLVIWSKTWMVVVFPIQIFWTIVVFPIQIFLTIVFWQVFCLFYSINFEFLSGSSSFYKGLKNNGVTKNVKHQSVMFSPQNKCKKSKLQKPKDIKLL